MQVNGIIPSSETKMSVKTNLNSDPMILKLLTIAIMPATITEKTLKYVLMSPRLEISPESTYLVS
jgi:hypothetical protein